MSGPRRARGLWVAALAIALGAGVAWLWWGGEARRSPPAGGATPAATATVPHRADPTALVGLHEPGTAPRDDLRIVGAVIRNYLHSGLGPEAPPLGFNEEIVRALGGANPLGVIFLPPDHPAIDGQGRLCDRWGTPYFFHPLSAEEIEIRSAGPDRKLFNADDLVGSSAVE